MKKAIGSRKLRMVLLAQVMFTVTTVLLAWFGVSEEMIGSVNSMIFGALGIGVASNIGEHITDTIKVVKAAKAAEVIAEAGV